MQQGICKLCLHLKPLIKKSHIIPDFMYNDLFNQLHKIRYISKDSFTREKSISDGIYDQHILCKECDNETIGKLETYMSIMLYGGDPGETNIPIFTGSTTPNGVKTILIENIDYTKTKLFLLSILWRAGISKHQFFSTVSLGKYSEILRDMLKRGDAGEEDEFETCVIILSNKVNRQLRSIIAPKYRKLDGNSSYVFYINGLIYNFNISKTNKDPLYSKGRISKNNTMRVLKAEREIAEGFFDVLSK